MIINSDFEYMKIVNTMTRQHDNVTFEKECCVSAPHTTVIMLMTFSYKLPTTEVWQANLRELRADSDMRRGSLTLDGDMHARQAVFLCVWTSALEQFARKHSSVRHFSKIQDPPQDTFI